MKMESQEWAACTVEALSIAQATTRLWDAWFVVGEKKLVEAELVKELELEKQNSMESRWKELCGRVLMTEESLEDLEVIESSQK